MWEQMNFIWGVLHVRCLWSARCRNIACPEFRKGIWAKVSDLEIENADCKGRKEVGRGFPGKMHRGEGRT